LTPTPDPFCRECGRSAAESETLVFAGVVAFTCSSCLMTGADSLPTCRRCLGAHWDAQCDYNVTEAKAAQAARVMRNSKALNQDLLPALRPEASAESKIVTVATGKSATSATAHAIKASRRGRRRVDPTSKRASAAARQRAYRERHRVASEQSSRLSKS
jgi:hypothetical protein